MLSVIILSYKYFVSPVIVRKHRVCRCSYHFQPTFSKSVNKFAVRLRMPKTKISTAELRQLRLKEREIAAQKPFSPPSEIYFNILGNGARGSARCLYVFTDHSRYLFNCGEGTQRLAHEYKVRLSKLQHVFVTHKSWRNLGGLLGLSLTIQDIGVPQITLHGPPNIENLYDCTKPFITIKDLEVDKRPHTDPPFVDSSMEVEYIPIYSSAAQPSSETKSASDSGPSDENTVQCSKKQKLDDDSSSDVAIAYGVKGHTKPGHLILSKCVEHGVPAGPLLGELKNGNDVTLPNGKIVRSEDVLSEGEKCPIFLVVECPSEDFLDSLLSQEKFKNYQWCADPYHDSASVIVHFTPAHVMQDVRYKNWMMKFPFNAHHYVLNELCSTLNSVATHRIQDTLHLLHPRIFQILHETQGARGTENLTYACSLMKYFLRPNKKSYGGTIWDLRCDDSEEEARRIPGFESSLKELHIAIKKNFPLYFNGADYPEVVFLGTGSCIPSKVRNVTCILVHINPQESMLLDCGEGSFGQLMRNRGEHHVNSALRKITCVFISHVHADHHLGLFTLLKERARAFHLPRHKFSPVTIIAPPQIGEWLEKYDAMFEKISPLYRFVENSSIQFDIENVPDSAKDILSQSCKNFKVSTVPVIHAPNAYGAVLHVQPDWKLVYSGDTIPCETLIDAGKDCDLLIHEATMEDDLEEEAASKLHSTTSQAIEVAEKMSAKYTILTHFSQRYAKVPMFNEKFHSQIGCAFDNMAVRPCDLPIMSLFIPTLQILFADHVEKLLEKGTKRKRKLELLLAENP